MGELKYGQLPVPPLRGILTISSGIGLPVSQGAGSISSLQNCYDLVLLDRQDVSLIPSIKTVLQHCAPMTLFLRQEGGGPADEAAIVAFLKTLVGQQPMVDQGCVRKRGGGETASRRRERR